MCFEDKELLIFKNRLLFSNLKNIETKRRKNFLIV